MRCKMVLPLFLVLVSLRAVHAQPGLSAPTDPATLMPEKIIAYAEVYKAGALAKEIGNLFQSSALADVPASLDRIRSKYAKELDAPRPFFHRRGEELGVAGLMLAPEVLAELGQVQGAAIALTGMNPKPGPMPAEFLAVILPGKSNAPGFLFRAMLTMAPMHKVDAVEGVAIYAPQMGGRAMSKPPKIEFDGPKRKPVDPPKDSKAEKSDVSTEEQPPDVREHVLPFVEQAELPVFAMTRTVLVVGTYKNVKDGILRLKGKLKTPSLAQTAAFKEARQLSDGKPGLFTFSNPQNLLHMVEDMQIPFGPRVKELVPGLHEAVNPRAFRSISQSYSLDKGKLTVRETVLLNAREKSPVLELLPTRPLNPELFHFAPKDAVLAAIIDNSSGEQRFRKFVALVDSLSPREGNRRRLSDDVKEAEKHLGIDIGKDILGRISRAGIALGDPLQVRMKNVRITYPNGGQSFRSSPELPLVIILQATSEEAAENLIKLVPKIFEGGKSPQSTRAVAGRELTVIKLGGDEELCYGREGSVIVLGPLAQTVALSLNNGAARQGLLANPQAAARIKELPGRQALALVKPANAIAGFAMLTLVSSFDAGPVRDDFPRKDPPRDKDKGPEEKQIKKPEVKVTYHSVKDEPMAKELAAILSQGEFMGFSLMHTRDRLQLDGHVSGLRPLISRLTDFAIEEAFRQEVRHLRRLEEQRKNREKSDRK